MDVPLSAIEGRRVDYMSREVGEWKTIGSLEGLDYFGDGSLHILETPGVGASDSDVENPLD